MDYPSLLFTNQIRRGDISDTVFDDLRLNTLLSPAALCVMSGLCPASDIPLRAELLDALDEPRVRDAVTELTKSAAAAAALEHALRDARGEDAQALLFVRLVCAYGDFLTPGSRISGGFFLDRFARACSDALCGEGFAECVGAARALDESCGEIGSYILNITGERFEYSAGEKEGALSAIERAAHALGIEPSGARSAAYTPCGEFTAALLSLHPELTERLRAFAKQYRERTSFPLLAAAEELNFICEADRLRHRFTDAGIPLCSPVISQAPQISARSAYDVTLLSKGTSDIVPNDISLSADEPFFFLSGANGGGKTTYLRTLGVNVIFALSGMRAAALSMTLSPPDGVFTHFPRDEHFSWEGRFANETRRADDIISSLGSMPLVLLNETYSTTNEEKALAKTEELAARLHSAGAFGVYVTHAQGVHAKGVPLLGVEVDPEDENARTYKVRRADAQCGSYASDILKKYGLTREQLNTRFPPSAREGSAK